MIGRTLGPYQLIERLERIGLYETYRGLDPRRFGQPVAITVVDLPADDADFRSRFAQAAERLIHLRHPNIVPLLDFGEVSGQAYLVTPHLEGPLLATIVGQPRRPAEVLGLIATIGDALDFAHRQDLAHGGLTPDAIQLLNLPPGEDTLYATWPMLLQLGYAAAIGPNASAGSIADAYHAPAGAEGAVPHTDCYALAGVLHTLLTGVPPQVDGDPTALATLSDGFATVLRRALSAAPDERYASCPELLLALRDAAAADRRDDEGAAGGLLNEARTAVAAGKFRAASEAYSAYLRLRPQDELARREFATIESRRAALARRRAEAADASAAAAQAAANANPVAAAADATEPAAQAPGDEPPRNGQLATIVSLVPPQPVRPKSPGGAFSGGPLVVPSQGHRPSGGGTSSSPPRAFDPLVSPARERRRAILPGALAAIALLLTIGVAVMLLSRFGGNRVDGDPPASVGGGTAVGAASARGTAGGSTHPIATNIPNSIPIAPTIAPLVPTPTATVPPLPPVIADTFDNQASGFPLVPGEREGAGYQNGEYVLSVPDPDGFEIAELTGCPINGNCTFGDFQAEVDAWAVGPAAGGSYGLVFHRQFANSYTQYFVLINPETGTVRLVRWVDTQRVEVVPEAPNAAIARGAGKNHIVVSAKGTSITVQINGVEVARLNDPGPITGIIGLRADAGSGPLIAHFDNFIIRPVR